MLQEEMTNIRTMQQSQNHESTGECTGLASAQSTQSCLSEYEINSTVKGQRCGHTRRVGLKLKYMDKQVGPSSSATVGSSTLIPDSTSS